MLCFFDFAYSVKFSAFLKLMQKYISSQPIRVVLCLFFLGLLVTTEAMGIWRFAGAFAVAQRQSECGSKTAEMHVKPPMDIGVC